MYDTELSFLEQAAAYSAACKSIGADDRSEDARSRALAALLRVLLCHGSEPAEGLGALCAREHLIDAICAAGGRPDSFRVRLDDAEAALQGETYSAMAIEGLELLGADSESGDPRWWSTGSHAPTVELSQ